MASSAESEATAESAVSAGGVGDDESHPLTYRWWLWKTKTEKDDYEMTRIASIDTLEEFWLLFNFIENNKTGIIEPESRICFFRDGIDPNVADAANAGGGRIVITSEKEELKGVAPNVAIFRTMVCC